MGGLGNQTNHSFLTDRSGTNSKNQSSILQQPGSYGYKRWKDNLEYNLQNQRTYQPMINDNSKKIIESKRVNNSSGSASKGATVHQRLH
jgi:hypothetical protein